MAGRMATLQSHLESSRADCGGLRGQLEAAQRDAQALREQLSESASRHEAVRGDRDKLLAALAGEQAAAAAGRQEAEALRNQLKASEEGRQESEKASALHQAAARQQHEMDVASLQKQYESQLMASERQYLMLQKQYDAGLASSDKLGEVTAGLRRERDAMWAEVETLKTELEGERGAKAELAAKLSALRAEVRGTMEQVTRDRDSKLHLAADKSEALVRDIKAEAERRISEVQGEYEKRMAGLLDLTGKLKSEAEEARDAAEQRRTAAQHLKEQVRELLLARDNAERELAAEHAFNEELNRIINTIKAQGIQI